MPSHNQIHKKIVVRGASRSEPNEPHKADFILSHRLPPAARARRSMLVPSALNDYPTRTPTEQTQTK